MERIQPTERRLGIPSGVALVTSCMIGTGIYSTSGLLMRDLGSAWLVLLAWALGGLVAMAGALTYGRLASAMPVNGGEYVILTRLYHPGMGFVAGLVSAVAGFAAPLAAAAVATATYVDRSGSLLPKQALALLAIWVVTGVHLRGVVLGSRLQLIVTAANLLLMATFIFVGIVWGDAQRVVVACGSHGTSPFSSVFAHALVYVSFSYTGYNAAIYVAGEIKQPDRSLPRVLILATVTVTLLYLLINFAYLSAAPIEHLSGVVDVGAVAIEHLLGKAAGVVTAVLVSVGLIAFMSATTFAGPRVLSAMSYDYRRLAWLSPRAAGAPPRVAILLQSVLASVLVVTSSFEALLTYVGLMLSLSALLGILGVFRLARFSRRYSPNVKVGIAAAVSALLLCWVIVATMTVAPWSALTAGLTLLLAWGVYRWVAQPLRADQLSAP